MTTFPIRALVSVLLAGLSACTSSPWYPIQYAPAPVEVAVSADAVQGSQARVLVSVLGVTRAEHPAAERVLVRVRVENLGHVAAEVPVGELALLSADLQPFGKPTVTPATLLVEPDGAGSLDASFPYPAGRTVDTIDWSGLNLRIAIDFSGTRVTTGASFARIFPVYVDDPNVTFGFGVGYVHD
jgi:hypothetical protein